MARYDVDALVEEVLGEAQGHTIDVGQLTWLTAGINASALSFTVDSTFSQLSRGIAEVGDELVFVAGVNRDTGECTVAPFGRGYQGTAAQTWGANTRVTMTPRFPRARVLNAINDIIENSYPMIYGVAQETFVVVSGRISYPLNADAEKVLRVEVSPLGGVTQDWELVDRWAFNRSADTTDFPTGKTLDLYEAQLPSATIQVTYATRPTAVTLAQEFADSGLRPTAWPAIKYGAVHMIATGAVAGEASSESVSAGEANRKQRRDPSGVQREYFTLHRQYLLEERDRLLEDYPPTNNREW